MGIALIDTLNTAVNVRGHEVIVAICILDVRQLLALPTAAVLIPLRLKPLRQLIVWCTVPGTRIAWPLVCPDEVLDLGVALHALHHQSTSVDLTAIFAHCHRPSELRGIHLVWMTANII